MSIITDTAGAGFPQQQPKQISLSQTTPIGCGRCPGTVFMEGYALRSVSRLITGEAEDRVMPVSLMYCAACGTVVDELLSPDAREIFKKEHELNNESK